MLELHKLSAGYNGSRGVVVKPTSLTLEPGSFVCVIGRNGAGKSTLMRTICGLQPALSGKADLEGRPIANMSPRDRAQAIAVVTTDRVSSPGLLARDVVELGRQPYTNWRGELAADDLSMIHAAIEKAGATLLVSKPFDSLSDGEKQRIMIARALAQSAQLMVLDEITAFLDLPGRVEIMALLRRYAKETNKVVILSSHDLELSLELADQLWIVHAGQLFDGEPSSLINEGVIGDAFDCVDVRFDIQQRRFIT